MSHKLADLGTLAHPIVTALSAPAVRYAKLSLEGVHLLMIEREGKGDMLAVTGAVWADYRPHDVRMLGSAEVVAQVGNSRDAGWVVHVTGQPTVYVATLDDAVVELAFALLS